MDWNTTMSTGDPWSRITGADASDAHPLVVGADIDAHHLMAAFRRGLFPFTSEAAERIPINQERYGPAVVDGRAVLVESRHPLGPFATHWWLPTARPTLVDRPAHLPRSLRRGLRNRVEWVTTADTAMEQVLDGCRESRSFEWLTPPLVASLTELHDVGWAHSVEVWDGDRLIGGVYGLAQGRVMSLDSFFTRESGAGKVAVADMVSRAREAGVTVVDCQWPGDSSDEFGCESMSATGYDQALGLSRRPVVLPQQRRHVSYLGQADPEWEAS